jgi:hypothetical protein
VVATGAVPELALTSLTATGRQLERMVGTYILSLSRPAGFLTNQILRDAQQAGIDLVRFGS